MKKEKEGPPPPAGMDAFISQKTELSILRILWSEFYRTFKTWKPPKLFHIQENSLKYFNP